MKIILNSQKKSIGGLMEIVRVTIIETFKLGKSWFLTGRFRRICENWGTMNILELWPQGIVLGKYGVKNF